MPENFATPNDFMEPVECAELAALRAIADAAQRVVDTTYLDKVTCGYDELMDLVDALDALRRLRASPRSNKRPT